MPKAHERAHDLGFACPVCNDRSSDAESTDPIAAGDLVVADDGDERNGGTNNSSFSPIPGSMIPPDVVEDSDILETFDVGVQEEELSLVGNRRVL